MQSQPSSMTGPKLMSSSESENFPKQSLRWDHLPVTPQDFWPELDPFNEGDLPLSDFFNQHLATLALCVQKWHSGSPRHAAAHSSCVSAPSGYKLWPEYLVPFSMLHSEEDMHTCKKREIPEIYLRNFFWIFRKILGWECEINTAPKPMPEVAPS